MSFGRPLWLIGGLLLCAALPWLWRRHDRRQQDALARFVSAHLRAALTLSVSPGRRRLKRALLLAAVALLCVALAAPRLGFRWEIINRRGIQIMFALDTSRSMSTPDVKPDRLTRAKLAIDDFTLKLDGDAIGLLAFAGDAFVVCPLTLDYGAFHESLAAMDTATVPRGGTNIATAIGEAQAALQGRSGEKILILITDGENLEGDVLNAARAAAETGLRIYTIGVGTREGDLIPLGASAKDGFLKDEDGHFVKSQLDETTLKGMAAASGGLYAPLGAEGQGLDSIYQRALAPLLKHDLASRRQRVPLERFQWPLGASLALLLVSLLIGNRRAPRRGRAAKRLLAAAAPSLSLLVCLAATERAHASPSSAQQAYQRGDYAAAERDYAEAVRRDPNKPVLDFNLGAARYRAGNYPAAAQAFKESIARAPSGDARRLADQEDAYYDLGNSLYRLGQQTEKSAPQTTLEHWQEAVKAYESALALRPQDADSRYNRDLVKRKIEELKKNQQNSGQGGNQNPPNSQNPSGGGSGPGGKNSPPAQEPPSAQNGAGKPPPQSPPKEQNSGAKPPPNTPPGAQNPSAAEPPPANGQNQNRPGAPRAPGAAPPSSPGQGAPRPADGHPPEEGGGQSDSRAAPGEMSPAEARQLLDSQKGDERNALGVPYARREAEHPPDQPQKDW